MLAIMVIIIVDQGYPDISRFNVYNKVIECMTSFTSVLQHCWLGDRKASSM